MILLVIVFATLLRVFSLNQSLWLDEATSALTTRMSFNQFFGQFMPGDFHPPLYYLILRVWSSVFGTSEVGLRSLSVVFGIATVYIVYLIGSRLVNRKTGLIAALLLATSGLHIYYSQEARMYAMSTFLVSISVYFFTKIFHEEGRVGNWLIFSLLIALLGITDYLPLLILPVFFLVGVVEKKSISWWKKFMMSHIILTAVGVSWLPWFIKQINAGISVTNNSPSWVNVLGKFTFKDVLLIPVKFVIGRISFDNKIIYALVIAISISIIGYLLFRAKKEFSKTKIIWFWLFIPILIALVISIRLPVLNYFRFLFVLPAFYLIIGVGISQLEKRWQEVFLLFVLGINLITSSMYLFNQRFQREDWRSAVYYIETNRDTNSVVVFPAHSQMEAYKYYAPNSKLYGPEGLSNVISQVWLVRYAQPISDPDDTTRLRVEGLGYQKVKEFDFNEVTVWEYINGKIGQ